MGRQGTQTGWAKQKALAEALFALARDRGPGAQLPTVRELCARFDVSTSTLDPVLRSLELRGVITRHHGRGIFVAPTVHQKAIGVVFGADIFSERFSPFWGLLLNAVRSLAPGLSIRTLAYLDISANAADLGSHVQLVEDLEDGRLDGVLLLAPRLDNEIVTLRRYGTPLVVFGHDPTGGWSVQHDDARFLRLAARAVVSAGGRHVAMLSFQGREELLRFGRELKRAGAAEAEVLDWTLATWHNRLRSFSSREEFARRLMEQRLAGAAAEPFPDVLVSTDDTLTRGAITALIEGGRWPRLAPRIVTAANVGSPVLVPYADHLVPIAYDPVTSMREALQMLATLMAGEMPPKNPVRIAPRFLPSSDPDSASESPRSGRNGRAGRFGAGEVSAVRRRGSPSLNPPATDIEGIPGVASSFVYASPGGVPLALHLFLPPAGLFFPPRPAIVFFFGGGWRTGRPAQFAPQAQHLATRGLVAALADYRVAERHGTTPFEAMADARAAIRWLHSHAAELGLDASRIAAGGGSAGGHLALSAALIPGPDEEGPPTGARPDALALFNAVYDTTRLPLAKAFGSRAREASPLHHLDAGTLPPTILFHGMDDRVVPYTEAVRFAAAARQRGWVCDLVGFRDAGHGFFNPRPGQERWYRETLEALERFFARLGWIELSTPMGGVAQQTGGTP
mgnify:CR=1 FL=1